MTKQRPRSYRVMLHNDDFNRREYVVKVLLKVLDNFTMEDAINCMQARMHAGMVVQSRPHVGPGHSICPLRQPEESCWLHVRSQGLTAGACMRRRRTPTASRAWCRARKRMPRSTARGCA